MKGDERSKESREPESRRPAFFGPLALLGSLLAVGSILVLVSQPEARVPEPVGVSPPAVAPKEKRPLAPVPATPVLEVAADGVPIKPHVPHEGEPDGPMHPHATTPAHERIYRENNLLGALNGAMDVKDAAGLRKLLDQYRTEYPDDPHALQEGYSVIADCLDKPGDVSREAARSYYQANKASTLRRYVRRHCLET